MLVVYEAIKDELRELEETDLIRFSEAPQIGQTLAIGSERRWSVVDVETYTRQDKTVYVAMIHPEDAEVPDRSTWAVREMQAWSDNLSFDVQLWQKSILGSGWSMEGIAPTGRLYGSKPTNHESLMERYARPWAIDIIETYRPMAGGSYTAVHVCHCVPVSLPELAIV